MNNLKKLLISLAFGLVFGLSMSRVLPVQAASGVVSPKEIAMLSYTTIVTTVTPAISSNSVSAAAFQPGAVYELIFSSATTAATDFFQMYDSTTSLTLVTCGNAINGTVGSSVRLGPQILIASGPVVRFDPPLIFHNGLIVCSNVSTVQVGVTYELGRGLQGN